jgi:2-oxoisovalerate dehydrogenase E1 component
MPSNARDAAGLLRAALRCGDPVLFLEHKHLYRRICSKGSDPGPDHVVPIGKARMVREGKSVSVITYGTMVEKSLRAAEELALEGIEVEILDLRSLEPYDWEAIRASVSKTNRVVVAHEDARSFGYGAEIAARIAEELFGELDAPVGRVGALDLPVAYSPVLEQATLPQVKDAYDAIRRVALY